MITFFLLSSYLPLLYRSTLLLYYISIALYYYIILYLSYYKNYITFGGNYLPSRIIFAHAILGRLGR